MEKRHQTRKRVRVMVQAEPGAIRAYTADLSREGMFLVSAKVLRPGTELKLAVQLHDGRTAQGGGVVRWAKRVPPSIIRSIRGGMGVELTWISPELQEFLDRVLPQTPR